MFFLLPLSHYYSYSIIWTSNASNATNTLRVLTDNI